MTAAPPAFNPGRLKLELSVKGVRLDPSATAGRAVDPSEPASEAPRGVDLVLPEELRVSAPIDDGETAASPFVLHGGPDGASLRCDGRSIAVRVVAPPRFYDRASSSGIPMVRVGAVNGAFLAINPSFACGYTLRGAPCRFCRSGSGVAVEQGFPLSLQDVVEVVGAAFGEGACEFVLFNLAYVGSEDAGIAFLEPYIRAVKRHFDTLVAVQIHPPKTDRWIDRTYAMGVDALSYSVEIHDAQALAQHCAGRARYIGRARYYEALPYAASVFPKGTVWSDLVVGLEPVESTLRGVDTLTAMGVVPVLSLYRPGEPGRHLPALEELVPLYAHLFDAVRNAGIPMGRVRDLGGAVTPLEARFFAGGEARGAVALQQFYRTRLGSVAARSLARLRRRLRVRTVSDSFGASHL
jgi:sodium-dependent dicarboxylate transporter 2/3/5